MSYFVTTNAHDHRGGGRRTAMILSIEQERLTPDYVFSPGETIAGAVLVRPPAREAVYGNGKSAALPNADPDPDVRLECRCEVSLTFHPQSAGARPGGGPDGAQRVTHTYFLTDVPLQPTSDRSTRQLIIKLAGVDSPEESGGVGGGPWRMYRFAHRLPAGNIPSSCQVEEEEASITGRRGSTGSTGSVTYSVRCSAPGTSDAIQRAITVLASLDLTLHPYLAVTPTGHTRSHTRCISASPYTLLRRLDVYFQNPSTLTVSMDHTSDGDAAAVIEEAAPSTSCMLPLWPLWPPRRSRLRVIRVLGDTGDTAAAAAAGPRFQLRLEKTGFIPLEEIRVVAAVSVPRRRRRRRVPLRDLVIEAQLLQCCHLRIDGRGRSGSNRYMCTPIAGGLTLLHPGGPGDHHTAAAPLVLVVPGTCVPTTEMVIHGPDGSEVQIHIRYAVRARLLLPPPGTGAGGVTDCEVYAPVTVGTEPITAAQRPRRLTALTPAAPTMITPATPPPVYGSWTEAESARSDAHIGRRSGRGGGGGGVEPRRRQEERGVKTALVRVSSLRPSGAPRPAAGTIAAPILVRADVHSAPALHLPPVTS